MTDMDQTETPNLRAAIIHVDGTIEIDNFPLHSYDWFNTTLNGWIETVPGPDTDFWCNEEGKLLGFSRNDKATELCQMHGSIFGGDYIVGTLIVTGKPDGSGESTGIPDGPVLDWLRNAQAA
jgi:hypothetical protein